MTGTIGQQGKMKFATKLLPNCFWGVRYVVEIIGGPDRDRTDDLFHAMEARSQLRHRPTAANLSILVETAPFVKPDSCPIQDEPEGRV
jgi:hypothetical protein